MARRCAARRGKARAPSGVTTMTDITSNYHGGNAMSEAAFKSTPKLIRARQKSMIFSLIQRRATTGLTCDEIEAATTWPHQSVSARMTELKAEGLIVASLFKRKTRTGRNAQVWVAG